MALQDVDHMSGFNVLHTILDEVGKTFGKEAHVALLFA